MNLSPTPEQVAECRSVIAAFEAVAPVVLALQDRAAKAWSALEIARVSDDESRPMSDEMWDQWHGITGQFDLYNVVADLAAALDADKLATPACTAAVDAMHERWRHDAALRDPGGEVTA